jgi:hypothetical protein
MLLMDQIMDCRFSLPEIDSLLTLIESFLQENTVLDETVQNKIHSFLVSVLKKDIEMDRISQIMSQMSGLGQGKGEVLYSFQCGDVAVNETGYTEGKNYLSS